MESLVLHENHVPDFKSLDEVLDRGSQVATTGPNILNVRDFIGVNSKCFSEPSVVELKTFVFEKFVLTRVVENLLSQHDEARVVSTSQTNIVEVVETSAELGTDQGVSWRVELSSHTVGLEAEDAGSNKVDVIAPSCNDGVSFNGVARHACSRETLFVTFPSLCKGHLLAFANSVSNKTVFSSAAKASY